MGIVPHVLAFGLSSGLQPAGIAESFSFGQGSTTTASADLPFTGLSESLGGKVCRR